METITIPRELFGYVENGSDTVVIIYQDDATRDWVCKVGSKVYIAGSITSVIVAAVEGEKS